MGVLQKNGVVTFNSCGVVASVEVGVERIDSIASLEYYDGVLIPALVLGCKDEELREMTPSHKKILWSEGVQELFSSCTPLLHNRADDFIVIEGERAISQLIGESELPLAEVLSRATLGGARASGTEAVQGSFERGKRCGAVVIEGIDFRTLSPRGEIILRRLC